MTTRTTLILGLLLVLAATVFSLSVYQRLPEQMASHWDVNSQVDGTMPRFWGALLMPIVTLGLLALLLGLPAIDPLKANIAEFRGAYNLFVLWMVLFMTYMHGLILAWNLGATGMRFSAAVLPAVGLLFILVGILLAQARRNFVIGIRTPWTLSSDSVWTQTHRLGSKLFIACGVLALLAAFLEGPAAFWLLFAPLIGSTLFLVLYSYLLYRQETRL